MCKSHGDRAGQCERHFNTCQLMQHSVSWTRASKMGMVIIMLQHGTHHEHDMTLSTDGSAEVLESSTATLCIGGNVRILQN
jgi:hypothetical protein